MHKLLAPLLVALVCVPEALSQGKPKRDGRATAKKKREKFRKTLTSIDDAVAMVEQALTAESV